MRQRFNLASHLPNLENPGPGHCCWEGKITPRVPRECILTSVSNICHPLAQPPCARSRGYGKLWSQGRVGRSGKALHWTWEIWLDSEACFSAIFNQKKVNIFIRKSSQESLKRIYHLMVGSWGARDINFNPDMMSSCPPPSWSWRQGGTLQLLPTNHFRHVGSWSLVLLGSLRDSKLRDIIIIIIIII